MEISDLIHNVSETKNTTRASVAFPLSIPYGCCDEQMRGQRHFFPVSSSNIPAHAFSMPFSYEQMRGQRHYFPVSSSSIPAHAFSMPFSSEHQVASNYGFAFTNLNVRYKFTHPNSAAQPISGTVLFYDGNPAEFSSFHEQNAQGIFWKPGTLGPLTKPHLAATCSLNFEYPNSGLQFIAPEDIRGYHAHSGAAFHNHRLSTQFATGKIGNIPNERNSSSAGVREDVTDTSTGSQSLSYPHPITTSKSTGNINQYVCCHCKKSFQKRFVLRKHINSVHLNHKPFACNLCDKRFSQKNTLLVHQKGVHFKAKPHQCNQCKKNFTMKGDVERHIRTVHMKIRPHTCDECGASFGLQNQLTRHTRSVHHTRKDFLCSHCNGSFRSAESLQSHVQGYHFKYTRTKKQDQTKT